MNDVMIQIIMLLLGAIIGLYGQMLDKSQVRVLVRILSILLVAAALIWFASTNLDMLNNLIVVNRKVTWNASYYDNTEFDGKPTWENSISGQVNGLSVDWSQNAPKQGLSEDYFSVDFITDYTFSAGDYCFEIEVDDGALLFIDGQLIRNTNLAFSSAAIFRNIMTLKEGQHMVEIFYTEHYGNAALRLHWYIDGEGPECVTVAKSGNQ